MTTLVLDAGVIIGALDSADAHHRGSVAALAAVSREELVVPGSVLAEVLVRPYSRGPTAVQTVERFLADLGTHVHPLDEAVAHAAAKVRASHTSMRLPDALTIATAIVVRGAVLTTDRVWPAHMGVPVKVV